MAKQLSAIVNAHREEIRNEIGLPRNEQKKLAQKRFYDAIDQWINENNIPREITSVNCRTMHRTYLKVESYLINCPDYKEIDNFCRKLARVLTNKGVNYHHMILEKTLNKFIQRKT